MPDAMIKRQRPLAWMIGLALVLGTMACYWPVRHFEYINLDDPLYVYENPTVQQGLTWHGFVWAFHDVEGGNWNPLVWMSHMLDWQLYGLPAGGHHLTNVILHIANVLLLFFILRRLTGALWRSALTAALFAWHPLHVESVAWVSERKDVLSTLFWLLTVWAYVRFAQSSQSQSPKSRKKKDVTAASLPSEERVRARGKIYYSLAILFFALGLMSKPMLVTLPVALLLLDWWPLGRINDFRPASWRRLVMEKIPFFGLSLAASALAVWAQSKSEAVWAKPFPLRLENAAVSCATYLLDFIWPAKLAVFYPYPDSFALWRVGMALLALAVITFVAIRFGKERRYLTTGWFWFLVTLLPVIGLVQVGMQSMADRYTYVPYIGLGLMASWGLADWTRSRKNRQAAATCVAIAALAGCVIATRAQVQIWRNSLPLYEHALKAIPDNWMAHNNLGNLMFAAKNYEAAADHLAATVHSDPKNAKAYNELGKAYLHLGKMDDAMPAFSNAARINPGLAQARWNLGNSYLVKGDMTNALAEMKASVELSPDDVEAHKRLAETLFKLGRPAEATPYCEMVVKAAPGDPHAHFAVAITYMAQKKWAKAVVAYKEADRLAPGTPECLNALAWIYATCPQAEFRKGKEAVRLAEQACALTRRRNTAMLDTLGAAYAEAERFEDAIKTVEEARALAATGKDEAATAALGQRLELYKAGNPFRSE